MTVLSWLTNDSIRPNRYIHRKLDKLKPLYDPFEHKRVQTTKNHADVASQGINLMRNDEDRISLWLRGPAFPHRKGGPLHTGLCRN